MMPETTWQLPTQHLGQQVLVYDAVPSTNDLAAQLAADPAQAGTAILAEAQTAGRGQFGRRWQAPAKTSVLLSVLLFPPEPLQRPVMLTAWAAAAVAATITHFTQFAATIKWPNDVLVEQQKLAGILIEQGRGTVVGIGLNVNQDAAMFTAAGLPGAGSMAMLTGQRLDTEAVARQLLDQLDRTYGRLLTGDPASIEHGWRTGLGLEGQRVEATLREGGVRQGYVQTLSFDQVTLVSETGQTWQLVPENIQALRRL